MRIIGSLGSPCNRKLVPQESFQAMLATGVVQALLKACGDVGGFKKSSILHSFFRTVAQTLAFD